MIVELNRDIRLINGELIADWHLDNLADEIDDIVKENGGVVSVVGISSRLNLPGELALEIIQKYQGSKIRSFLKVNDHLFLL